MGWKGRLQIFFPNLSIFEIEKYFKPLFGSLELQFYWQKNFDAKIGLLNSGHSAYLLHGLILVWDMSLKHKLLNNFGTNRDKVRTFWETHKIWKNLPHGIDKSADLLSKRQNHEEDFFKLSGAFPSSPY